MIRLIPGQHFGAAGGSDAVMRPGSVLRLQVISGKQGRWKVLVQGKEFYVSSKIPLKKGDILVVRVQSAGKGLELKLLNQLKQNAQGTTGLEKLISEDPILIRSMMRAGLPLKDPILKRLRATLGEKDGSEREEGARLLSLLEEKGIYPLFRHFPPFSRERHGNDSHRKNQHETEWRTAAMDAAGTAELLRRSAPEAGEHALFNHKKSSGESHWLKIPFRIGLDGKYYTGELRLALSLSTGKYKEGGLLLQREDDTSEEWIFALSNETKQELIPIVIPDTAREKLPDFAEKVRKLGIIVVDTMNRGKFDGYSVEKPTFPRGIDAEV